MLGEKQIRARIYFLILLKLLLLLKCDPNGYAGKVIKMEPGKLKLIKTYIRNFFSELFGTAILLFVGCMGLCKGVGEAGDKTGMVLTFGLAIFIVVQICSQNSGGHVNPAVTILSLFFKKLSVPMACVYICGQIIGGIVGFGLLKAVTPSDLINLNGSETHGLCTTVPNEHLSLLQSSLAEFLLTSILLLSVCSLWDPRNTHHDSAALKLGFVVYALAFAGVAYTGASMNPARSFGPALLNWSWKHHWIYWVSPVLSAVFCGFFYTWFFCPKISSTQETPNANLEMNA